LKKGNKCAKLNAAESTCEKGDFPMSDELKRWQAHIYIGPNMDEPVTFHAESHYALVEAVRQWLNEDKPMMFGNAPPNYEINQRVNYVRSEKGWDWVRGSADGWAPKQTIWSFDDVVDHFVAEAMIIEKGPDYQDVVVDGELRPHLIRTVCRESDERRVNDMLRQGWYIIACEYKGSTDFADRLISRQAIFVLGHPEPDAMPESAMRTTD
jgi:hypothetical protein